MLIRPALMPRYADGAAAVLGSAPFWARLTHSLVLERGTGSPTFTRATTGAVQDHEGVQRTAIAGEARFTGARRVRNEVPVSSVDLTATGGNWTADSGSGGTTPTLAKGTSTLPDGTSGITTTFTLTRTAAANSFSRVYKVIAGTGRKVSSLYIRTTDESTAVVNIQNAGTGGASALVTATPTWSRVYDAATITAGSPAIQIYITQTLATALSVPLEVTWVQYEDITGRADQTTPSEYVSVGALDYRSTQDPLYLSLPGTSGHYASTPDSAANSITGDIDIRVKVAKTDWTPATADCYAAKWNTSLAWLFRGQTTGELIYNWSADGASSVATKVSSVATGFIDGTVHWVRVTHDVDNGAGGNDVKFYTSEDGVNWTQLGTTQTTAGTTSIFNSTAVVEVGSASGGTANQLNGKIYSAQIYDEIDGTTPLVDFNPHRDATTPTGTITSSTTGEVWTINGASSVVRNATYHGTGVDGVKCFDTDLSGNPIPLSTLKGYLAEAAATNLCTKSQEFDAWATSIAGAGSLPVVTANAGAAPDGTTTADKVVFAAPGAGDISAIASPLITVSVASVYTSAVYIKAFAAGDVGKQILHRHAGASGYTTLTLTADWQRLGSTETAGVASITIDILLRPSSGGSSGTVSCYLWGAQVELGSAATSYIPTTTIAVQRNGEIDSLPTSGNILAAAGTIALTYTPTSAPSGTRFLWGTYVDASNYTAILHDATNLIFRKRIAGVNTDATIANAFVSGTTYKMCASWGAAGQTIYLNGTAGTPNANTNAAQIAATMQIGADGNSLQQPGMSIKDDRIWLRQLSASEQGAITR